MKKRRFCRRWDVKINSQTIAQLRGLSRAIGKKVVIGSIVRTWFAGFFAPTTLWLVRPGYSMRRAFMGWMLAARLAGMMAAKNEQIASATAAIVSAAGSHDDTP